MSIAHFGATGVSRAGELFTMVSGLELTQNTGYDNGDGTVPVMGSLTPAIYRGRAVHRVRKDNSGLNVTLFQTNAGDIDADFWSSIFFTGPGGWNNFEVFASSRSGFADNSGSASWNGLDDAGAFINGQTYFLEWFA